jgi:hypothetical protein
MHYKFLTTELLTPEPCALIAAFQHFILRFTKNFLTKNFLTFVNTAERRDVTTEEGSEGSSRLEVLWGLPSLSSFSGHASCNW